MTIATLPNYTPSRSTRMATRHPVRAIRYGGGHTRYIRDGAASAESNWSVHWGGLSHADGLILTQFLDGLNGIKPFLWTPPAETAPLRFICMEWTMTPLSSGHQNVDAVFVRQYI